MTADRHSRVVLYHSISKTVRCNDGFAAAFCAWLSFGDTAKYIPYHHGSELPSLDQFRGKAVYFLDFAPDDVEQTEEINSVAYSFLILDHHKTSRELYAGKPYFMFTEQACSEAAWTMFGVPGQELPKMFAHIADNDLWLHHHPQTKAFIQRLTAYPYTFDAWRYLLKKFDEDQGYYRKFLEEGEVLLEHAMQHVSIIAATAMPITLNGIAGLAVNYHGPSYYVSAIGEELAKQCGTCGAMFVRSAVNEVSFELRACGNVNVAEIACSYGGGGHPNSAGFRVKPDKLNVLLGAVEKPEDPHAYPAALEKEFISRALLTALSKAEPCSLSAVYRMTYETLKIFGITPTLILVRGSIFSAIARLLGFVNKQDFYVDVTYEDKHGVRQHFEIETAKPKWHWTYF